tara:strand:- start:12 stop:449 length:438 start_codon:yes stop_codon:yes gene_type:complete
MGSESIDLLVFSPDLRFDAWGKRCNATDWEARLEAGYSPLDTFCGLNSITTRGFTGHEMVDSVGIIHMNGRIYDPKLGQFLQADSFTEAYIYTCETDLRAMSLRIIGATISHLVPKPTSSKAFDSRLLLRALKPKGDQCGGDSDI